MTITKILDYRSGWIRPVGQPDYRRLHQGFPAGGPMDRFSAMAARRLLGVPAQERILELPPASFQITVQHACQIIVTGAPFRIQSLQGNSLPRWTVRGLQAGTVLDFTPFPFGCYGYLAAIPCSTSQAKDATGRSATCHHPGHFPWAHRRGDIRVLVGPEGEQDPRWDWLIHHPWQIDQKSSPMGFRLAPVGELPSRWPNVIPTGILSAPTQDGVLQATPNGWIALMRHRGTIGGYPRIASIIDPDVDRLAQYRPGQIIRFQPVSPAEAKNIAHVQQTQLNSLPLAAEVDAANDD